MSTKIRTDGGSFTAPVRSIVDAWRASDLDDKGIGPLAAALQKYDGLSQQLHAAQADAAGALEAVAAEVVAAKLTLAQGVADYAARAVGDYRTAGGATFLNVVYDHCRRQARRAVEAEAGRIPWQEIIRHPAASAELVNAIRYAGLVET